MRVEGRTVKSMMRKNRVTISSLAASMNVTQKRVREVLSNGVDSYIVWCDWHQAITGDNIYRSPNI